MKNKYKKHYRAAIITFCCTISATTQVCTTSEPNQSIELLKPQFNSSIWNHVGGNPDATKWSSLRHITSDNINDLRIAWIFKSGKPKTLINIQASPLFFEGRVYGVGVNGEIFALDAKSGVQIWATLLPDRSRIRGFSIITGRDGTVHLLVPSSKGIQILKAKDGCVFRSKVATRFGLKWPPNSEQSGHLFRSESGRFLAAAETGGRHVPK